VSSIIGFYGKDATFFQEVAGPGNFNDPDMLIIGNFGLSPGQEKVQMGMWAIMASPLIMSVDLRNIRADAKALLQNKNVLSINQDALGKQGKLIQQSGNIQVWNKPLVKNMFAFAYLNTGNGGNPSKVSMKLSDFGLTNAAGYNITEVFEGTSMGKFLPTDTFTTMVNPTGIFMGKAVPIASSKDDFFGLNNVHKWKYEN
jgi:alpha-N-acetylgalactosaminidase